MRRLLCTLAVLGLGVTAGCGDDGPPAPGRFSMNLSFEGASPGGEEALWVFARVEERSEPQTAGTVLAEAPVVTFDSVDMLRFEIVPHGDNRVIVVELRDGESDDSAVRWFGLSKPFSLHAGDDIVVDVAVDLRSAPGAADPSRDLPPPQIAHASLTEGRVASALVELRVPVGAADTIVVANDPGLFTGRVELALSALEPSEDPTFARWPGGWDLDAGLCAEPPCTDGERSVYVQLRSEWGYALELPSVSVALDRTPPSEEGFGWVADVNAGGRLLIEVDGGEPLSEARMQLRHSDGDAFDATLTSMGRASARFAAEADDFPRDGQFAVVLTLRDLVGNETHFEDAPTIRVDTELPQLVEAPALSRLRAGATQEIFVDLEASEALDLERTRLELQGLALEHVDAQRWRYLTRGDEGPGLKSLSIRLVDEVGNEALLLDQAVVELDFDPPRLIGAPEILRCDGQGRIDAERAWLNEPDCEASLPSLTVRFNLDEVVPSEGGVQLSLGERPFEVLEAPEPGGVPLYALGYTVTGAEADGGVTSLPLTLELSDAFGNSAVSQIGELLLDFDAPAPPAATTPGVISFERNPYGRGESLMPHSVLHAAPGAFEAETLVRVLDRAEPELAQELARTVSDARGAISELVVAGGDRTRVFVLAVDAAGNAAPRATEVLEQRVTLLPPPESDVSTPRVLTHLRSGFAPPPGAEDAVPQSADAVRALRSDGDVISVQATGKIRLLVDAHPGHQWGGGGIWDPWRERVVRFGGAGCAADSFLCDRTFELGPQGWGERIFSTAPAPRGASKLAFDHDDGSVLLFGGVAAPFTCDADLVPGAVLASCEDTWRYDGRRWEALSPSVHPSGRSGHAIAWDPISERVILFGGYQLGGDIYGDTWAWDGEGWSQLDPPESPSPRFRLAAAAHASVGRLVIFGGCLEPGANEEIDCDAFSDETWSWTGATWQLETRAGEDTPPPTHWIDMAYDPEREKLVLPFPTDGEEPLPQELIFEWDDAGWTRRELGPTSDTGSARIQAPVVWDGHAQAVRILGGSPRAEPSCLTQNNIACPDDLLWDGERLRGGLGAAPPGAEGWSLTWDTWRNRGVRFGGLATGGVTVDHLWELEGERWIPRARLDSPPPRDYHAQVFDSQRGLTYVIGGRAPRSGDTNGEVLDDMWAWDGERWQELTPATRPSGRYIAAHAYDSHRGETWLVAGCTGAQPNFFCDQGTDDVWSFDGVDWQLRPSPPGVGILLAATLTYDPRRRRLVLFAGFAPSCPDDQSDRCNDVWEWDGEQWTRITPVGAPPPHRLFHAAAWDSRRQEVVIYGGESDRNVICGSISNDCADAWSWNGERWQQLSPRLAAAPRALHAFAHDPLGGRFIIAGGRSNGAPERCSPEGGTQCSDVWVWEGSTERPYLHVDYPTRGVLDAGTQLLEATVRLSAGGGGGAWPSLVSAASRERVELPSEGGPRDLPLVVREVCQVQSAALAVGLDGALDSELLLTLSSPGGQSVELLRGAPPVEAQGRLHFPEPHTPLESMGAFLGVAGRGSWTLRATDLDGGEPTTLRDLRLELQCAPGAATSGFELRVLSAEQGPWSTLLSDAIATPEALGIHTLHFEAGAEGEGVLPLSQWGEADRLGLLLSPRGVLGNANSAAITVDTLELELRTMRTPQP